MTQEANKTLPPGSVCVSDPDKLHHWLCLALARGIGSQTAIKLLEQFGSASDVIAASDSPAIPSRARTALQQPRQAVADATLEWLAGDKQRQVICWNDPAYPYLLKQVADPPLLLFIEGDPQALASTQLAIVGSRKATPAGLENTRNLARALATAGIAITSGLALGIDASAHLGALQAQGLTIAVLGNGLDKIYPARHEGLARDIVEAGGVLVSEFAPGMPPLAGNFPRRNRIISGLSYGVLVVEAALRSGSLITARLAAEQGREVFAMPGSVHNPLARGCHKLLREGAVLVENIEDILNELPGYLYQPAASMPAQKINSAPTDPGQQALLECMGYDPVDTDTLVLRSGLTAERVSSMLLLLELQGSIADIGAGRFQRCETQR